MPSISIIVPFSGSTADLIPDLKVATEGAELIIIDNASDGATAQGLTEFLQPAHYIRNRENLGFAAANNQGYSRATGDVIMFLNSDVAAPAGWLGAVLSDVKDGALYGPSLQAQLVAGRHIPYLEGWCIAATRGTWERLCPPPVVAFPKEATEEELAQLRAELKTWAEQRHPIVPNTLLGWPIDTVGVSLPGPWRADLFGGPYWEDNYLCYEAIEQGMSLIQTAWQIHHKGGRTAGPIMKHGESFARNERTFTDRVMANLRPFAPTPTWHRYMQAVYTQSDIQHHLGLLYSLARGNVVELGTRTGVSTSALLAGVEAHGGKVISIDLDPRCADVAKDHPQWAFWQGSSTDRSMAQDIATYSGPFDLLLIDTEHTYEQAAAELELWAPYMRPGGHILLHDTETFPGVLRAVKEFCQARNWTYTNVRPCNGMAIVEVPG